MFFKLFWSCPLKIKITQFPGVFRLKALQYGIYRKVR